MNTQQTVLVIGLILLVIFGAWLAVLLYASKKRAIENATLSAGGVRDPRSQMPEGPELERRVRGKRAKKPKLTVEEKLFQAGLFSQEDRKTFERIRIAAPIVFPLVLAGLAMNAGIEIMLTAAILGVLLGVQAPQTYLDRKILARAEEIMYYLPLVIEQIAIGVSSSLDIGPCIQRVVMMADERDTHNAVSELVRVVVHLTKSGLSLDDALTEIGKRSGHTELKHTFMSLAQVSRHGGEITRQLQELADAVASQRETKIEAKIKKLELEATLPVALVFCGFMVILLIGFFLRMKLAFA